jgi:hypothetical protein
MGFSFACAKKALESSSLIPIIFEDALNTVQSNLLRIHSNQLFHIYTVAEAAVFIS